MPRYKPSDQKLADHMRETERMLNELRADYELYFLQQVRTAPEAKAKQLATRIREMDRLFTTNTGLKFKRNALRQRYGSLRNLWQRTMAAIEAGTYHRHRVVADRRDRQREATRAREKLAREQAELDRAGEDDEQESTATATAEARAATRERAKAKAKAYAHDSTALFEAYVDTRKRNGESLSGVDRTKLTRTLQQHVDTIQQRTGARRVVFRVATEEGKTRLKAIPIK